MSIEKKKKIWAQIIIMSVAFAMMIMIWPARTIKHMIRSVPQSAMEEGTERVFGSEDKLLQTYTPQCDYLKQINLYVKSVDAADTDTVTFVLYDSQYAPIFEETYFCADLTEREPLRIMTEITLVPGEVCYYELLLPEGNQGKVVILTGERQSFEQVENGILFDAGVPDDVHAFWAEYDYVQPMSALRIVVYYIAILIIGAILYVGLTNLMVQFPRAFEMTEKSVRILMTAVLAALMFVAFYFAVWDNYFGGALLDRIVYALGILGAGAWGIYAIFHKKQSYIDPFTSTNSAELWRTYLQTICFAGVIYFNCMYVNATEMKYQYENTRWMLICLGFALIVSFRFSIGRKRDLWRIGTELVWIIGSFIYAVFYCKGYAEDANAFYLARLYMAVMLIWGVVILHTLWLFKPQVCKKLALVQTVAFAVFCVGMFVYRYEKIWPFVAVVPILVLILQDWDEVEKGRMLRNLCNGILVAFILITGKALLYRPYMKWTYYRYPGYFHTVACTGMFLAIVVCAALVKFYIKTRESEHIFRDGWRELFLCGMALIYMFMTMSRTALMAIGILYIGIVFLMAFVYKRKWKHILIQIGMICGATVLMFPVVYSATRIIPAVVNEPYRFEPIEPTAQEYPAMIEEGDAPDSDKYMSMERFLTVFAARIKLPDFLIEQQEDTEVVVDTVTVDGDTDMTSQVQQDGAVSESVESLDTEETVSDEEENTFEVSKGLTNGRMDIYRTYLGQLTIAGHEKMGYKSEDGTIDYGHAHNSYIQAAYDFGIPTGILFLILCGITFIYSIYIVKKMGNRIEYTLLLFGLVVVFGVVSLTEWAFHPNIPVGFCFLWSLGVLMTLNGKNVSNRNEEI